MKERDFYKKKIIEMLDIIDDKYLSFIYKFMLVSQKKD